MQLWAKVDATSENGTTRVGGVPLIARHVRMAARQKWAGAVVVVDEKNRPRVERVIADAPAPEGFPVEITPQAPSSSSRTYVPLRGDSLYSASALGQAADTSTPPVPLMTLSDATERGKASRVLIRSLRKPMELDGIVAYTMIRPISRACALAIADTKLTPNHVTLMAMACGIVAGLVAAAGGALAYALAGILYWWSNVVDCVDGELARLRLETSRGGEWLDTVADDVCTYGLMIGLGVGLWHDGQGVIWLYLGVGGALGSVFFKALMYWDLHRKGLPIDTTFFPWFFGAAAESMENKTRFLDRLLHVIGYVFRKDSYVTLLALVLVVPMPRLAALGLLVGDALFAVMLTAHFVVTAARRGRQVSSP
ncbi:MAG: CDP-alcohol phosphatidyltransferase family protein [Deltaproteobacteria bacterium]|nr:CDP-alcohol phosphatidyltransferase family protein [Deltaproteobacteria bacterium]